MTSKADDAVECFMNGYNCAQAVFSTYAEGFGISWINALKISSGFGSGMGRLQSICGALTGAYMLIGCKHGKIRKDDAEAAEHTYSLVLKLSDQFCALHGKISCRELLVCDLKTPEGQQFFKENNLKELNCAHYVRDSARLVEALLFEE